MIKLYVTIHVTALTPIVYNPFKINIDSQFFFLSFSRQSQILQHKTNIFTFDYSPLSIYKLSHEIRKVPL